MKRLIFFVFALLFSFGLPAQNLPGYWEGKLNVGTELRIGFNITTAQNSFSVTLDSPDQGITGVEADLVRSDDDSLVIAIKSIQGTYRGKVSWSDSTVTGSWIQRGFPFPMVLRKTNSPAVLPRPQTPKAPFPYTVKEIEFKSVKDTHSLSGTLTIPENGKPGAAVIMITGSGPQDRDETLMGHKPFLVIADYLSRNGIAVLRYDDRGIGKSGGNFATSTIYDFADDVRGAIRYLKSQPGIDSTKIGLLGHSEGSMVSQVVCAGDPSVAFFVSLAGPGEACRFLLYRQLVDVYRVNGISDEASLKKYSQYIESFYDIIIKYGVSEETRNEIRKHVAASAPMFTVLERQIYNVDTAGVEGMLKYFVSDWFVNFIRFEPEPYLKKITCPVLAVNGSTDIQVAAAPNLEGFRKNCSKKILTVKEYPGLNHLFQHSVNGNPNLYGKIEETISEEVLKDIKDWILKQTK